MSNTDVSLSAKFEVTTIPEPVVEVHLDAQEPVVDDAEKVRKTLHGLIDTGEDALKGIMRVADFSESPRAYEVAGQLIKAVADAVKDLATTQKIKEKTTGTKIGRQTNVFVGTSAELLHVMNHPETVEVQAE